MNFFERRAVALHDHVFFFSIYQRLQYVPSILVTAFFFPLFSFWKHRKIRYFLLFLTPLVGVYAVASTSKLAVGTYFIGIIGFFLYFARANHLKLPVFLLIFSFSLSTGYFILSKNNNRSYNLIQKKFSLSIDQNQDSQKIKQPYLVSKVQEEGHRISTSRVARFIANPSVSDRLGYWFFYTNHITESAHAFFWGHPEPPDIKIIPSSHNYYLDFIYNFGFLPFVPFIIAVTISVALVFNNFKLITESPSLLGLTFSVFFLLFVDNMFKVGMRQLYPGIASFFLWGLLVNQLLLKRQVDLTLTKKINSDKT